MSVCPSAWNNLVSSVQIFMKIGIFAFFRKSDEKILVSLKSDKNNGFFTWRLMHIYDHISLSFSWNEKHFRHICTENQKHILYSVAFFFSRKSYRLWDIVEKHCRVGWAINIIIRHINIVCWITKATNRRSEYIILNCFTTATVVTRTLLRVKSYVHRLHCWYTHCSALVGTSKYWQ